jgi:hypothetical protein
MYPFDFVLNRGAKGKETAGITNSKPRISLPFATKSQDKSKRISIFHSDGVQRYIALVLENCKDKKV